MQISSLLDQLLTKVEQQQAKRLAQQQQAKRLAQQQQAKRLAQQQAKKQAQQQQAKRLAQQQQAKRLAQQQQAKKQVRQLSYPFRFYPVGRQLLEPAWYNDIYTAEIIRCKKFLEAQNYSEEPMYVVLTVGSLIDNQSWPESPINRYIHFPHFLRGAPFPVQIICIAPLASPIPELIKIDRESGKNWEEIGFLSYRFFNVEQEQDYYYYHFNTLLPEFIETDFATFEGKKVYWKGTDKRLKKTHSRTPSVFTKIIKDDRVQVQLIKGREINFDNNLDTMIRTSPSDKDLLFVNSFYTVLTGWMNRIQASDSTLFILNFAVFKSVDVDFDYFCKKLYAISHKYPNTIFLSFMFHLFPSQCFFKINYFDSEYANQNFIKKVPTCVEKIGVQEFRFTHTIDVKLGKKTYKKTIFERSPYF
jgi:hypothetical protein